MTTGNARKTMEHDCSGYLLVCFTPDEGDGQGEYVVIVSPGQNPEKYCEPGWCVTMIVEIPGKDISVFPVNQKLTTAWWEGSFWPMCAEACHADRLPDPHD